MKTLLTTEKILMANVDNINFKEIYKRYKSSVDRPISYTLFKQLYTEFINRVIDNWILQGEEFNMHHKLGTLKVIKKKRDFNVPRVNMHATKQAREKSGDNSIIIYFTDKIWFRFNWVKVRCYVKNKQYWSFLPNRDNGTVSPPRGMRNKLSRLLNTDPFSKERFKFVTR